MKERPLSVILIVVGTLAIICILYAVTMSIAALHSIQLQPEFTNSFKEYALVALGAIGGLLTSMSTGAGAPIPTTVTNPPSNPVITQETKEPPAPPAPPTP